MRKRIHRLFDRLKKAINAIEDYNSYMVDHLYSDRHQSYFSHNVKMYVGLDSDDVEEIIKRNGYSEAVANDVRQEFNDSRLEGVWHHFYEQMREDVRESGWYQDVFPAIFNKYTRTWFMGRSGGHLCVEGVDLEIDIGDYLGQWPFWKNTSEKGWCYEFVMPEYDDAIAQLKESEGLRTLKDVYDWVLADVEGLENSVAECNEFIRQSEALERHIEDAKKNAQANILEMLADEIQYYLNDLISVERVIELAEEGDTSFIDELVRVDGDKVATNRNASVSTDAAIQMVYYIKKGVDVSGRHIGPYTINKIYPGREDTYVKIGCHIFSLNRTEQFLNTIQR